MCPKDERCGRGVYLSVRRIGVPRAMIPIEPATGVGARARSRLGTPPPRRRRRGGVVASLRDMGAGSLLLVLSMLSGCVAEGGVRVFDEAGARAMGEVVVTAVMDRVEEIFERYMPAPVVVGNPHDPNNILLTMGGAYVLAEGRKWWRDRKGASRTPSGGKSG